MQKPLKINSTLILLNSFVFHCSRCKVLLVFKHGLYLISAYQISFSFLSMACLHRNLWAHVHCWFYRMASVQCRQHNPWKVSVCLLVRSYFLAHLAHIHVSWALLIEFCWFYSIRFLFCSLHSCSRLCSISQAGLWLGHASIGLQHGHFNRQQLSLLVDYSQSDAP